MPSRCFLIFFVVSACVAPASVDETTWSLHDATTVVSLTFDDTLADNVDAATIAAARDMRAVFFVNSARIGASGYMTRDQLLAMQQQGHEVGGHTITHARLTELSETEAREEVCNDRVALLDAGFAVTSFAYPFAANNATVEQIVEDCGYNSARDVGGLVSPGSCSGCPYANPIPPPDPYRLRTGESVDSSTTLADLQQQVIQAEQNGGGLVPFVFHHICDGCASNAISPATFAAFLDWLAARAPATQVGTVHEVIGGEVRAGVTEPPSTEPPPPSTNLLSNPSLEVDDNGNQVPDCWQRGGFGTSTATYELVSDAHDGNVAQRITITSWSSGGRRLVSAQDGGACAPSATPGRQYTMTAYYKATTQPRFSVYYRDGSGAWVWFAQSPLLPTSSTYRQATYTTPELPSDATAISLGLTIFNVGTITMDTYTLVDASSEPTPTDTTPPALSIACNDNACSTSAYPSPVTVSLSASDAESGVSEIRYTTDGSDPATGPLYTAPFSLSTSATVRATAVDNAGNRTSQSASIVIEDSEPPPPPAGNLLQNASLEVDANGNQVPDCWKRDGYGTNTASYSLVSDAFDGSVAQRIDITSWSSGGRRLASAQDNGTCAPSVTPGRSYTMTAYYKASVQPRFSVFVRSTSGPWRWFAESAALPTSATYRQAIYTTPPMPSDAVAISIGLSIFAIGSITTDTYTLVDASSEPPPTDTTPPSLSIACNDSACSTSAYPSPVTVSLSASDAESGVSEIRYTTDGSDPATGTLYTAPFSLSTSATVRATAVDNAGNRTSRSASIVIDGSEPAPAPTNLLQNASLELDADGNQIPDCWKRDGYGTNTASYSLVSGAFDGSVAQRLDITSWSSGGRRLASAQDAGACAPSVTAGQAYTMTAYYMANVQPRFSVFIRTTSGTWQWFAESAALPTSATYLQGSYTTPPMPSDAVAISIGLSIFSEGSITTDAYTLVEAAAP